MYNNPELADLVMSSIFYDQDGLIAINKPAGITTHSGAGHDGVSEILTGVTERPFHPVHRLDRGTTGVLLLACERNVRRSLSKQFCRREIKKVYRAVVDGIVEDGAWDIDSPVDFKEAQTAFTRLSYLEDEWGSFFSLVEARPLTGRTHQIRVHLSMSGHPVTGDPLYNANPSPASRPLLHAVRLECRRPNASERLAFEAYVPEDFKAFKVNENFN